MRGEQTFHGGGWEGTSRLEHHRSPYFLRTESLFPVSSAATRTLNPQGPRGGLPSNLASGSTCHYI